MNPEGGEEVNGGRNKIIYSNFIQVTDTSASSQPASLVSSLNLPWNKSLDIPRDTLTIANNFSLFYRLGNLRGAIGWLLSSSIALLELVESESIINTNYLRHPSRKHTSPFLQLEYKDGDAQPSTLLIWRSWWLASRVLRLMLIFFFSSHFFSLVWYWLGLNVNLFDGFIMVFDLVCSVNTRKTIYLWPGILTWDKNVSYK